VFDRVSDLTAQTAVLDQKMDRDVRKQEKNKPTCPSQIISVSGAKMSFWLIWKLSMEEKT
jgi:hypothetical protein